MCRIRQLLILLVCIASLGFACSQPPRDNPFSETSQAEGKVGTESTSSPGEPNERTAENTSTSETPGETNPTREVPPTSEIHPEPKSDAAFPEQSPIEPSPPEPTVDHSQIEKAPQEVTPEPGKPDNTTPDKPVPPGQVKRVVLAGDSWSTGLIGPTRAALNASGFSKTVLSYQYTANAGSQAEGWVANKHPPKLGGGVDTRKPKMLTALFQSLDAQPRAGVLILVIGGNDYNRECVAGLGSLPKILQKTRFDKIQKDIQTLVNTVLKGRPHLKIVLIGYDYFHFEFLKLSGLKLKGHTRKSYNEGIVEVDRRKLTIARTNKQVAYAHNFGILQYTYGDKIHPPFPVPNPLTGFPPYPPKKAPKPGFAPAYHPFPGGFITYPAPLDVMPDGIHPSPKGFRTIIDNTLAQGLSNWLKGKPW